MYRAADRAKCAIGVTGGFYAAIIKDTKTQGAGRNNPRMHTDRELYEILESLG
jgi:hypothetical protein